MTPDDAMQVAIQSLTALLDNETLLLKFINLSGFDQDGLKQAIQSPEGLASILQFFMESEED